MFKKILLAYNGSHEGRSALLACAEIASFAKSETRLLAGGRDALQHVPDRGIPARGTA